MSLNRILIIAIVVALCFVQPVRGFIEFSVLSIVSAISWDTAR